MPKFVEAEPGPKNSVIYIDASGQRYVAVGGDRNWRNNNPGNLRPGAVSRRNGQIGVAGGFAVFPDADVGHEALLDSLKNVHGDESLEEMISSFAPRSENKTDKYLRFLRRRTGVRGDKKIKDFSAAEFNKLWNAIQDMEGPRKPKISKLPEKNRVTRVRKNKKGTIIAYYVDGMGWLSKQEGVSLARKGKIDAVVATSKDGKFFLRTRPGTPVEIQLDNLG